MRFVCAVEGRAAALSPRKLERPGVGGLGPRLGRRGVVSSTKCAVEMGQIREARVKRDGRNGAAAKAGIGQKAVGQFQTPRQHEFREGRAFRLEELMDIAGADPVAGGDRADRHVSITESVRDVRLDRLQACGSHAAFRRRGFGIPISADAQRDEVEDVGGDRVAETGRLRAFAVGNEPDIVGQQSQGRALTGYRPHRSPIEIRDERRERPARRP